MPAPRKPPLPSVLDIAEPKPESTRLCRKGAKSLSGAAEFLGISKSHMKKLVNDGVFTSWIQFGKRLVPVSELVRELARGMEEYREANKCH